MYRERDEGFNVRHFYKIAVRDHEVRLSYTFVRLALQGASLVRKGRKRGVHRKQRRASFGEMLHFDGSRHRWLLLVSEQVQTLIVVMDDATGRLLYAQLWRVEGTGSVMAALCEVVERYGIVASLYTDRAVWAFYTPNAWRRWTRVG